ncbi:hypothetical protein Tco_1219762 [Tanacetum coccineum]
MMPATNCTRRDRTIGKGIVLWYLAELQKKRKQVALCQFFGLHNPPKEVNLQEECPIMLRRRIHHVSRSMCCNLNHERLQGTFSWDSNSDQYQYEETMVLEEARKVWVRRSTKRCQGTWTMVRKHCEKKSGSGNKAHWKHFRTEFVKVESD